jgi:hypothetical protein
LSRRGFHSINFKLSGTNHETPTTKKSSTLFAPTLQNFYLHKVAIKLKHSDIYSTYFITFTCAEWISLIEITNGYDLAYNWFSVLKKDHNADVAAYVLMPNHLHVIVYFPEQNFNLNTILANGKRFMAYQI